jgi:hypothetical protein
MPIPASRSGRGGRTGIVKHAVSGIDTLHELGSAKMLLSNSNAGGRERDRERLRLRVRFCSFDSFCSRPRVSVLLLEVLVFSCCIEDDEGDEGGGDEARRNGRDREMPL